MKFSEQNNTLSHEELAELESAFIDLINYDEDDPCASVSPLSCRQPDGDNCLHIASHRGNLRAVELLIKAGFHINEQGDMGYTPLHYASTQEVVDFLLANGARTDIKNEFGNSPIGWNDKN